MMRDSFTCFHCKCLTTIHNSSFTVFILSCWHLFKQFLEQEKLCSNNQYWMKWYTPCAIIQGLLIQRLCLHWMAHHHAKWVPLNYRIIKVAASLSLPYPHSPWKPQKKCLNLLNSGRKSETSGNYWVSCRKHACNGAQAPLPALQIHCSNMLFLMLYNNYIFN